MKGGRTMESYRAARATGGEAGSHALLGASGAHRWLNCTPSARLEDSLPDTQSAYAAEGRLAHALAELKLRKRFARMKPAAYRRSLEALRSDPLYRDEMEAHTDAYADYIQRAARAFPAKPFVAVETRVDYSAWAPGGFGTADCVMLHGGVLCVADFKYGRGVPVCAMENPQLMLYALGATADSGDIREVRLSVVQPRAGNVSEWTLPARDLLAWGESIRPAAKLAWEGGGDFRPGGWCRFCRAAGMCRARSRHYLGLEDWRKAGPPLLGNGEIGRILSRAEGLAAWARELQAHALAECLAGREVPGWKAVEGRRTRAVADYGALLAGLAAAGCDEAQLYRREPLTLAGLEKALGREKFEILVSPYVRVSPGRPALVPACDRREPLACLPAATDFAVIPNESEE